VQDLLKRFKIFHERLDPRGRLVPSDPHFWGYLGLSFPTSPIPISEVFAEVVGMEEELLRITDGGKGEVKLPFINRTMENEGPTTYFNLTVMPCDEEGTPALVILEDETPMMAAKQEIVQRNNLITLLKQNLEKQNEELETKVRTRTRELHESRLSVIVKLARAAEFREHTTGEHIYRIGRSCLLMGKKMGLPSPECEMLFHASLLHDVGKIGIPDSILLKPDSLDSQEWKIMKTHTTIGYDLLGDTDEHLLFKTSREVVKFHHEKWNGKGYPDGLRGKEIPLAGRICAVADVFDALMSLRPYKEAWTIDRSVEEIKKESGLSFDPSIVESFFLVLDDIIRLHSDEQGPMAEMPDFL
jgi:response regulator RpfG family c-di-GMP phosphodiesterase